MNGPGTMPGDPDPGGIRETTTIDELVVVSVTDETWTQSSSGIQKISQNAALAVSDHQAHRAELKFREVTIVLSNDATVRQLNHDYRGLDKPTNVLSFPALEPPVPGMSGPLGDVILGYETVKKESVEFRRSLEHHVQHLVVHGCLHLLGYDHEADTQAEEMESLEIEILASLGIPDPYEKTSSRVSGGAS
jgi:probable rRNA maturation factor